MISEIIPDLNLGEVKSWERKILDPNFVLSQAIVFLVECRYYVKKDIIPNIEDDHKTFSEAMSSKDILFCKKTINDKVDSILSIVLECW